MIPIWFLLEIEVVGVRPKNYAIGVSI